MNNRKLLLISYNFPPYLSSRSIRMIYFVKYLTQYGWKIDVITTKRRGKPDKLLNEMLGRIHNVTIYETKWNIFEDVFYQTRISQNNNDSNTFERSDSKKNVRKYIPDRKNYWFLNGLLKGNKLIKANKYDAIMSVATPNICHIIGYYLSMRAHIPLILEYGDLWSVSPIQNQPTIYLKINKNIEKKIINHASAVIFTSDHIRKKYEGFVIPNSKFHTIYSGYDEEDLANIPPIDRNDMKILLMHIGQIYHSRIDIIPFLKAIEDLLNNYPTYKDRLEIILIGNIYSEFNIPLKIKKNIKFLGKVGFRESIMYMKAADGLLLFGNKYSLQIPQKTFLYMGINKRILSILDKFDDPIADVMKTYPKSVVVLNNQRSIYEGLKKIINGNIQDNSSSQNLIREDMTWGNRIELLDQILVNVIKEYNNQD